MSYPQKLEFAKNVHFTDVYTVSQKNSLICFCHIFVKFPPTLIIFGTNMAKTTKIMQDALIFHLNLCQCTTV